MNLFCKTSIHQKKLKKKKGYNVFKDDKWWRTLNWDYKRRHIVLNIMHLIFFEMNLKNNKTSHRKKKVATEGDGGKKKLKA